MSCCTMKAVALETQIHSMILDFFLLSYSWLSLLNSIINGLGLCQFHIIGLTFPRGTFVFHLLSRLYIYILS